MTDNQLEFHLPAPPVSGDTPLIPARMVNEFVYCPRLAYLMWTQGEWAETGDTVEGHRVHSRVDKPNAPLPAPQALETILDADPPAHRVNLHAELQRARRPNHLEHSGNAFEARALGLIEARCKPP